jgi:hypothetical protein
MTNISLKVYNILSQNNDYANIEILKVFNHFFKMTEQTALELACGILFCFILGGSKVENIAPSPHLNKPQSSALLPSARLLPPFLFLLACRLAPIKQARLDSKANLPKAMQMNPPRKTNAPSLCCFQRKTKESTVRDPERGPS